MTMMMTFSAARDSAMDSTQAHADELLVAAHSDVCVLITSERRDERVGRARSIHALSARCTAPFIDVDCATWRAPEGALTALREGFRRASQGTLFLDRIEAMSEPVQAQLFCLFDEAREGSRPVNGAPRIITGASRSLLARIAAGTFDEFLFYRLNLIHLDLADHCREGALMNIKDLMSTPPQTCRPETDLGTIAQMMWDHDLGFVAVVDASGMLVGVITDRDICIATATRHLLPERISAEQAMTGPVHTCMVDDSVSDALSAMKEFKVRRLPVIGSHGRLQGVISMNDIALASDQKRKPAAGEVVSTLAAICAHRSAAAVTT